MSLRQAVARHRQDHRLILVALVLLLLAAVVGYVVLLRGRNLPEALVQNRVLLFLLWYVNVVLILVVAFVLLRNLAKLVLERRSGLLGSKFKTKLVATYVGLALLPVSVLFVLATGLLRGSIERWFDTPLEKVLAQAATVARSYDDLVGKTTQRAALDIARLLAGADVAPADLELAARPEIQALLQQALADKELDFVGLYVGSEFVQAVVRPQAGLPDLPEPTKDFLAEVTVAGAGTRVDSKPGLAGRLIYGGAAGTPTASGVRRVVVAGVLLDPAVAGPSAQLVETYQSYRQLVVLQDDIEASHFLIFLMVTLLILLASSWTGLYLARRITQPIQALVEGTRRVSSGARDHRVEAVADDELGVLVDSFNGMTAELARGETLLAERNQELLAANRRLAEERARIAAVLENVAAGVVSVDGDGRVFTCNSAALAMLGAREQDVLGQRPRDVWPDGERAKLLPLFAERPDGRPREVRLVLGGEWQTFEAKVTALVDAGGHEVARVVVLEDSTELIKAQQLAAWNEAAKRIAHEINNPITPIRLSAERLLRRHAQGDADFAHTLAEGVDTIVRSVGTIKAMVDEFAEYARMPRPQPRDVELQRLVAETIHLYQGLKPGVEVVSRVPADLLPIVADPEQLKRALINLLDNALEATDPPGGITVDAGLLPGNGSAAVPGSAARLELQVADTGRGIPAAAKEKLFLPYFSTKGRGTGLGLAIVHRIVSDHQGRIRVGDNEPQGTIFTIELPA